MSEIDESTYQAIVDLCEKGDVFVDDENYDKAIQVFKEAAKLIPKPVQKWEAATWILTSIGETYFFMEDYGSALKYLTDVMHCPDAIGNPLIHMRLGQVHFELGNEDSAKDELARAYMGEGEEIFEDEDPKYLNFLKSFLKVQG